MRQTVTPFYTNTTKAPASTRPKTPAVTRIDEAELVDDLRSPPPT